MSKKVTRNQKAILKILHQNPEEMSAQIIHFELHEQGSSIGLATIYRNLKFLKTEGLIQERITPAGESLYSAIDAVEHHHHHFNCVNCGESFPMTACPINQKIMEWCQSQKFKVYYHTLEFFGLCSNCQLQIETAECFNAN